MILIISVYVLGIVSGILILPRLETYFKAKLTLIETTLEGTGVILPIVPLVPLSTLRTPPDPSVPPEVK